MGLFAANAIKERIGRTRLTQLLSLVLDARKASSLGKKVLQHMFSISNELVDRFDPTGATSCTQCASNSVLVRCGALGCDCLERRFANCLPGKYASKPTHRKGAHVRCVGCGIGKFLNKTAHIPCEKCQPGFYTKISGMQSCTQCKRGQYQPMRGGMACYAKRKGTDSDCNCNPNEPFNKETCVLHQAKRGFKLSKMLMSVSDADDTAAEHVASFLRDKNCRTTGGRCYCCSCSSKDIAARDDDD